MGLPLSRDLCLGLRPQGCQVLTLRLPAWALLGREKLFVFLLEQLADPLVDPAFVLPATRLLAPLARLLVPTLEHHGDGGKDEPAHGQEAEHPGDDAGVEAGHARNRRSWIS
jgi:hypothetical protein